MSDEQMGIETPTKAAACRWLSHASDTENAAMQRFDISSLRLDQAGKTFPLSMNMNFKKILGLAVTIFVATMGCYSNADAASVDVKCETRANRSKASVDGRGFAAGLYRARLRSGAATNVKWSKTLKRPRRGELEFDFDSDGGDIRAGATAISPKFIKGGRALGTIYSYNSALRKYTFRGQINAFCRAR